MWFHRADFDNYYQSRLVSHLAQVFLRPPTVVTLATRSVISAPKIDGGSTLPALDIAATKPKPTTAGVQSIGLPAAANQVVLVYLTSLKICLSLMASHLNVLSIRTSV